MKSHISLELSLYSDCYIYPLELFTEFTDTSFTNGRKVYLLNTRFSDAVQDNNVMNKIKEIHFQSRMYYQWLGGWTGNNGFGPLSLLNTNNADFTLDIYDITDTSFGDISYIPMSSDYEYFFKNKRDSFIHGDEHEIRQRDALMWTGFENSFHFIFDAIEDYIINIQLITTLPIEAGSLNVWFRLGDDDSIIYSTTVDYSSTNIMFVIPTSRLEGNNHVLHMYGDTWIPLTTTGEPDGRNIGIPISYIEAVPISEFSDAPTIYMTPSYSRNIRGAINGFENDGDTSFIWTSQREVFNLVFSAAEDYIVRLNLPDQAVPVEIDGINVQLSIGPNSTEVFNTVVNNDIKIIEFRVPLALLEGRLHELFIISDTWKPMDYGSPDIRELGFKLASIEAIPISEYFE